MQIELAIRNYRCFPDSRPARIAFRKGFTAFVGVNNSGKSSLLKFFYEFRSLFSLLSGATGNLSGALAGQYQSFALPGSVCDVEGCFRT